MHRAYLFCCRCPADRGQVRYRKREIPDKRSVARAAHTTRLCPEGVGADLSAKGCEAALEQATLILPGAPCVPVLLPVPGRSRTSPLLHSKQIADKRSVARSAAES
ncbi:hypothetical protein ALP30_103379, partial [Pseudomonas syringae pv. primulae]